MIRWAAMKLWLLLVVASALCVGQSLDIGGVKISVGESREAVEVRLKSAGFRGDLTSETSVRVVDANNVTSIIGFARKRVTSINRVWRTSDDPQVIEFVTRLIDLTGLFNDDSTSGDGFAQVMMTTHAKNEAGSRKYYLQITNKNRTVLIAVGQQTGPGQKIALAAISESVETNQAAVANKKD